MSSLKGFDSIFGGDSITSDPQNQIKHIRLCDLVFFENQKNPLRSDEELCSLVDSIKQRGVLEPIIVRTMAADKQKPYEHYQVLNGRHRTKASMLAGLEDVPAVVVEADDEAALYIVATTTIDQCHNLLPSVKAWAYKVKMEAEQQQGRRTDLSSLATEIREDSNFVHNVHKVDRTAEIASVHSESRRNIAYYIRLTYLVPELLSKVDDGTLPIRAGVSISYLNPDNQYVVDAYLLEHNKKISIDQAETLKEYAQTMDELTEASLDRLFNGGVQRVSREPSFQLHKSDLQKLIPLVPQGLKSNQTVAYIIEALQFYAQRSDNQ